MLTQKSLKQLLAFLNLYQHVKKQFIRSVHSWDSQFLKPMTKLATYIFDRAQPKFFDQFLISTNLHWKAKSHAISLISSADIGDLLKIFQSDWLRAFWPIPQNSFPKYWICMQTQQAIQILIIEQIGKN